MESLDEILVSKRKPKRKISYEGLIRRIKLWENTNGSYTNSKNKTVGGKLNYRRPGSQNPRKGANRKRVL